MICQQLMIHPTYTPCNHPFDMHCLARYLSPFPHLPSSLLASSSHLSPFLTYLNLLTSPSPLPHLSLTSPSPLILAFRWLHRNNVCPMCRSPVDAKDLMVSEDALHTIELESFHNNSLSSSFFLVYRSSCHICFSLPTILGLDISFFDYYDSVRNFKRNYHLSKQTWQESRSTPKRRTSCTRRAYLVLPNTLYW